MVYLAVDKNKKEWAFSVTPEKHSKEWKSPIIGRHQRVPIRQAYMSLEKGTIEKLIGKPLTFDNDPVQFENWRIYNIEKPKTTLTYLSIKEDISEDYSEFRTKKENKEIEPYYFLITQLNGCFRMQYRFKKSEELQARYTFDTLKNNFADSNTEIRELI